MCAGVQPPQDPGKPKEETASALAIDLERERVKNVVDKKIEERRKEAGVPWFIQKINKVSRQETCTVNVRPQVPSWSPEGVKVQGAFPFRS